jgi:hypothetical protein
MRRFVFWIATAAFAGMLVFAGAVVRTHLQPSIRARELREKHPYVSLESRLEFEATHPKTRDRLSKLSLDETATARLDEFEKRFETRDARARMLSLQELHSLKVNDFISRPRNGISRWGRMPAPAWIEYEEQKPITLDDSDSPRIVAEATNANGPQTSGPLPEEGVREDGAGAWSPSLAGLQKFHQEGQLEFTDPWSFGHVIDRSRVAGFVSHGFRELPELAHPDKHRVRTGADGDATSLMYSARWRIARLELVSLLKFDEPAVYISDHLPQMKELENAPTRPLTAFERLGLQQLQAGEDLFTNADTNEILMVGSLRAAKQCLSCHAGRRGELLGAFSYRLRRDPPLPANPARKRPAI